MSTNDIYVIHQVHTDVGFTNDQPIFRDMQYRFINVDLRLIGHGAMDRKPVSRQTITL